MGDGDNGHIVSLFSGADKLNGAQRRVVLVKRFNNQQDQITITRRFIAQADKFFLLTIVSKKIKVMKRVNIALSEFRELKVKLSLNAT